MSIVVGTNSFVDLAFADAYIATRIDAAEWIAAEESVKMSALITATSVLNSKEWSGVARSPDQLLAFPRQGHYYSPMIGYLLEYQDTIPSQIKEATVELAYHLIKNEDVLDSSVSVKGLSVSSIKLDGIESIPVIPQMVYNKIKVFYKTSRNAWFRAN